jgi:iron only hydrogenase large subunit-like protein
MKKGRSPSKSPLVIDSGLLKKWHAKAYHTKAESEFLLNFGKKDEKDEKN